MWARDLKVTITRVGNAVVCAFAGDLHMGNEDQVRRALGQAVASHPGVVAVDLSAVELFTSSGLNALLSARRAASANDVSLALVAPSRAVLRVFEITEADLVFTVHPTLHQALRHHQGGPATEAV